MNGAIKAIKGVNDVLPQAQETFLRSAVWQRLMRVTHEVMAAYSYQHVWLPLIEPTELYSRGVGTGTDIVSKEMYSFKDRGDRAISLRPEGTAGAVRAYIEHNLPRTEPLQKWYYAGPMFRAERPQKGRYRQFYQIGAEYFGAADPAADVELVCLLKLLCERLGLADVRLKINTLGDEQSRINYRATLLAFLRGHRQSLCASCSTRIEENPLRVLDCKEAACQTVLEDAPDLLDALTPAACAWYERYVALLEGQGIAYERDPRLVRGLDYYSHAIFEMTTTALGAQDALLGGGRYDSLVTTLGGPPTPAVGFGAGVERLALILAQDSASAATAAQLYLIPYSDAFAGQALALATALRRTGVAVELDISRGKVGRGMRRADKLGAQAVLVLGADEVGSSVVTVKRLADGATARCALSAEAVYGVLTGPLAP